jgi:hypothetical protein
LRALTDVKPPDSVSYYRTSKRTRCPKLCLALCKFLFFSVIFVSILFFSYRTPESIIRSSNLLSKPSHATNHNTSVLPTSITSPLPGHLRQIDLLLARKILHPERTINHRPEIKINIKATGKTCHAQLLLSSRTSQFRTMVRGLFRLALLNALKC